MSPHPAHSADPTAPDAYADPPAPQHFPHPVLPPQPRVVWPWAAFLLGAAALAGVWYGRPYWKATDADRVRRDLAEMRTLLARPTPEIGQALSLGRKALDHGSTFPQFVGEAHFLLGCAHLKKAEEAGDPDAEWREARTHFEQAELAGVPEPDQPRLAFRLGKVLCLGKAEPQKALDYLRKGEDKDAEAERWQFIADCCLKLAPPDVKGAIEATGLQAAALIGAGDGRARAQANYRLAELHLRLNEVAHAKRALEQVMAADSPELFDSSRVLLARCHQADNSYDLAAATWEQVRGKARPPVDKGTIQYELGYCFWKAGRLEDAKKAWDEAQGFGTEAAQASLLRKAELQLAEKDGRAAAVMTIEDALKGVSKPADYRNTLYPKAQAEQLLEQTCRQFKSARDWAGAGKLAELLAHLAGAAKGKELGVDVAEAWGLALLAEAKTKSGQAARHAEEEADKQFRAAAALAAELAAPDRPEAEQAAWLRRAANYYLKCGDKADVRNAVSLLDRAEKLSKAGPADGEIMYAKAVALEQLGEARRAAESYRACIRPGHPEQCRARHQLARLLLDQPAADRAEEARRLDEAAEQLAPNLDPAVRESHPEEAEKSAFLLGHIHYWRRDYVKAESSLSAALRDYPKSDEAVLARSLLGRCYWYRAGKESRIAQDPKLTDPERAAAKARLKELLEKARQVAEPLENELMQREIDQKLTDADRVILRQTSFLSAECYFFSENFEEAVRRYNVLRTRYDRQVEQLIALSQLWYCHDVYLGEHEKSAAMLAALRDALKQMPDSAFDNSSDMHRRAYWEAWIKRAAAPAVKP